MNESAVIESVKIVEVDIPYAIPFQISGGVSYSRKSLIIELESEGILSYGESAAFEAPYYSAETISSSKAMLQEFLIPKVLGKTIKSIQQLNEILSDGVRGNYFSKAGIETAYWDLIAKKNGISIKELIYTKLQELGTTQAYLQSKSYIYSGVSIGIPEDESYETLKKWIIDYKSRGYQRVKLKIRPGWDVEPLKIAKDILGDSFLLWPDANAAYRMKDHIKILQEIDNLNCTFIEQPLQCDDILEHAELSNLIQTPICYDESLKSEYIARHICKIHQNSIWNIKIQRVGGLYEACKIYALASQYNIPVWGGTMPESGIGGMSILALSTFGGFVYPACIEPSERWYGANKDLIEIEMTKEGKIYYTDGLGIGDIRRDNYAKYGKVIYQSEQA